MMFTVGVRAAVLAELAKMMGTVMIPLPREGKDFFILSTLPTAGRLGL